MYKRQVKIPVSLKTRIGFQKIGDESGLEACRIAEESGCSWVTLHGRTARQKFDEPATWEPIARLVSELRIPVIGNGDIYSVEDAGRMIKETGCAGVMIGRAMMGDPWIIGDTEVFLSRGEHRPRRSRSEIVEIMLEHQQELLEHFGPKKGVLEFRKHIVKYLRGFPLASTLRKKLITLEDAGEIRRMLVAFGEGRSPEKIE